MRSEKFDNIINEVKNNPPVMPDALPDRFISFDEVEPLSIEADVFRKDRYEEILEEYKDKRIIASVYYKEPNILKRIYKAIVRKFTSIMYLVAIEEQERHNQRSEEIERMILGRFEELDRENKFLKKRLEACEKEINRLTGKTEGMGDNK